MGDAVRCPWKRTQRAVQVSGALDSAACRKAPARVWHLSRGLHLNFRVSDVALCKRRSAAESSLRIARVDEEKLGVSPIVSHRNSDRLLVSRVSHAAAAAPNSKANPATGWPQIAVEPLFEPTRCRD